MKMIAASLLFIFSSHSFAKCFYSLSASATNYTVSESNSSPVEYSLELSRGNSNDSKCEKFLIGFSRGGSNSYNRIATNQQNNATIPYNLYRNANSSTMLKKVKDASSDSEVLSGRIYRNSSVDVRYFFKLGSLSNSYLTRGGLYRDTISLSVDSGDRDHDDDHGHDPETEATNSLQVNINVPKLASLSLVNSGSSYDSSSTTKTLDFGELSENEEMSFDVIVLSNAGYNLSVSSANQQFLTLQGATPATQTRIGYLFYANNSLKNISSTSPVSIMTGAGVTSTQGTRIPVKVVIQSVTGKDPGIYQDYVTFTIATTE